MAYHGGDLKIPEVQEAEQGSQLKEVRGSPSCSMVHAQKGLYRDKSSCVRALTQLNELRTVCGPAGRVVLFPPTRKL
jgi:hypothetical protein